MTENFDQKLKSVMADIFQVDIAVITDDCSPDTIEAWDSLQQLNLVSALEAEFSIELSPEDAADMLSYSLVKDIVLEQMNG